MTLDATETIGPTPAMSGDPFGEDPSVQRVLTPLWRELFFPFDWMALRASPVYFGCGVARGKGEPVLIVPGFLGNDDYLVEMYGWLQRIGYRPYFSQIGVNADCPDHLARVLLDTVRRARAETGFKPVLIGHSLGGMLARSVAIEYPGEVSGVIVLGSPFKDTVRAHPVIIAAADALRRSRGRSPIGRNIRPSCFSGHCTCTFVRTMIAPGQIAVPHYSIYSKTDGVVDWTSCREDDPELNTEVAATHIGMAFHPGVYRTLARRLAEIRDLSE